MMIQRPGRHANFRSNSFERYSRKALAIEETGRRGEYILTPHS